MILHCYILSANCDKLRPILTGENLLKASSPSIKNEHTYKEGTWNLHAGTTKFL